MRIIKLNWRMLVTDVAKHVMPRPSHNIDKRMLEAAKKIVCEHGCSGIRIRDIAAKAHANLGMFHYYFKSKRRFTKVLLQDCYDDFFSRLSTASRDGDRAIDQLRSVLLAAATFVKQEHKFYSALFKDILNENQEVLEFVRSNFPRHIQLIKELILRAQKEQDIVKLPFPQVMSFLMTSLNLPTLIAYALEAGVRKAGRVSKYKVDIGCIVSDAAIKERLNMALRGLAP